MARPVLFVAALSLASPLAGQDRPPLEIGMDGGLIVDMPEFGDNASQISFPFGRARVAFAVAERGQVETMFWFSHRSEGDVSTTTASVFPAFQYSPNGAETRGWFVKAGAGLTFADVDSDLIDAGDTRFAIGGGVGYRRPVAEAIQLRFEGGVRHLFESDLFGASNQLELLIGISVFARGDG
jgi:hypothetical protein